MLCKMQGLLVKSDFSPPSCLQTMSFTYSEANICSYSCIICNCWMLCFCEISSSDYSSAFSCHPGCFMGCASRQSCLALWGIPGVCTAAIAYTWRTVFSFRAKSRLQLLSYVQVSHRSVVSLQGVVFPHTLPQFWLLQRIDGNKKVIFFTNSHLTLISNTKQEREGGRRREFRRRHNTGLPVREPGTSISWFCA